MEVCNVQKSSLELSRWFWGTTIQISVGSLDPGRTFTNKSTTMKDSRERKKKLKLTSRTEHIFNFGGMILVQLERSLNLNRRAQDSPQADVERKPCGESSTHTDIDDVVCPTV